MKIFILLILLLFPSCEIDTLKIINSFTNHDISLPQLIYYKSLDCQNIEMAFSKDVKILSCKIDKEDIKTISGYQNKYKIKTNTLLSIT